jgi:hypothetical protein
VFAKDFEQDEKRDDDDGGERLMVEKNQPAAATDRWVDIIELAWTYVWAVQVSERAVTISHPQREGLCSDGGKQPQPPNSHTHT